MASNLRAGLVGLGMMGRNHARVLSSLEGVDLVGVADAAGDVTGVANGRPVFTEVEALLTLGLDYCVVVVPTEFHTPVGLALAEAKVPALIEKPLAHDLPSARKLVEAFAAAQVIGAVGHVERYNAALRSARQRLENGDLGEVYQIITRRQGPFPGRIADVGVVKDLATHDIDLTGWVTQQDYVSVAAQTSRRSGRAHEDLVAVVAELSDGTPVNHLVNWLTPFKERQTVVTGERGAFVADTLTADLTFYANGAVSSEWEAVRNFRGVAEGDMTRYAISRREPLMVEHEHFRDALLGLSDDIVTLAEGLRTVEISTAILAAADQGVTISTKR